MTSKETNDSNSDEEHSAADGSPTDALSVDELEQVSLNPKESTADSSAGLSIVDLIIQEQLQSNNLVLAPKEEKVEAPDSASAETSLDETPLQDERSEDSEVGAEGDGQDSEPTELPQQSVPENETEESVPGDDEQVLDTEAAAEAGEDEEADPDAEAYEAAAETGDDEEADPDTETDEEFEDDEWELTPEELAELAELEAEFEEDPGQEQDVEPNLEVETDETHAPAAEAEAETQAEQQNDDDSASDQDSESPSPNQPPLQIHVSDEIVLVGFDESSGEEATLDPAQESILLGPATGELEDDFFQPKLELTGPEDGSENQVQEPVEDSPEEAQEQPQLELQNEPVPEESESSADPPSLESSASTRRLESLEMTELLEAQSRLTQQTPPEDEYVSSESEPVQAETLNLSVGGQLRDVEKVLSEKTTGKLPWGIKKRALPAMKFLSQLRGIQRGMVIAASVDGELECVASGGIEGEKSLDYAPMRLLKTVFRTKEPILLLDGQKDPRFVNDQRLQEIGVRSGLCVPFKDCESGADGLLYVDNLVKASAFSYQDLRAVKEFAKKMATDYQLGETEVIPESKVPVELATEQKPTDPRLYVALLVAAIVLVFPALSNPTKEEPEVVATPPSVERVTQDPKAVVLSFIRTIESSNVRSAHKYLVPSRQETVSLEELEKQIKSFIRDGDNAWVLSRVSIEEESRFNSKSKRYRLLRADREKSNWKIGVREKTDGSWVVDTISGMNALSFKT